MTDKLMFGLGNSKLSKSIGTFSLPAGHTCPFAKDCLSKCDNVTGKITDGPHCEWRCFAASQECTYPNVRKARWNNLNLLNNTTGIEGMASLIQSSLPVNVNKFRIHVSGDFFNEKYFLAWLNVALNNPLVTFYGYTKAIPFLVRYKKYIPKNLRLTASFGGTCDHLIKENKLKYAKVVYSVNEAEKLNLEIDHDDSHAFHGKKSFALLLHGIQPVGTKANEAWKLLRKAGISGYNKEKQNSSFDRELIVYVSIDDNKIIFPHKQSHIVNPILRFV